MLATRILLLPLGSSSLSKASAIGDGAAFCITRRNFVSECELSHQLVSSSSGSTTMCFLLTLSPLHSHLLLPPLFLLLYPLIPFYMHSALLHALSSVTCTQLCYMHSALLHALRCVTCTQLCYMHSGVSHVLWCITCTQVCYALRYV